MLTGLLGTYAGIVVDPNDPFKLGRVKVRVPHVFGPMANGQAIADQDLPWALPVGIPSGQSSETGGMQFLPNKGDRVWVRFLDGEPEKPVWEWGMQDLDAQKKINSYGSTGSPSRRATWGRFNNGMEVSPTQLVAFTGRGYGLTIVDGGSPAKFTPGGGATGPSGAATQAPAQAGGAILDDPRYPKYNGNALPARNSDGSISTKATTFGLNPDGSIDREDNGQGAPLLGGINTRNRDVVGVAIPFSLAIQQFGSLRGARGQFVEVTNPATGLTTKAQIVDFGPSDYLVRQGKALDLTYGAQQAIGANGNTPVSFRFIGTDGTTMPPDGAVATSNALPSPNIPPSGSTRAGATKFDGYISARTPKGNLFEIYDDTDTCQLNVLDLFAARFKNLRFMGAEYYMEATGEIKIKTNTMDVTVAEDKTLDIGSDFDLTVGADFDSTVEGDYTTTTTGDQKHTAANMALTSKGTFDLGVAGITNIKLQGTRLEATRLLAQLQRLNINASGDIDLTAAAKINATADSFVVTAGGHTMTISAGGISFT